MTNFVNKLYIKGMMAKQNLAKALRSERGEANIIAIVLILVIVIALAIFFKDAIMDLFKDIWAGVTGKVEDATKGY